VIAIACSPDHFLISIPTPLFQIDQIFLCRQTVSQDEQLQYNDLTMMFLPKIDWIHLAHKGGCRTMVDYDQADEKHPQPNAMRTRSRVAKSMKHIALMKSIPKLRELQEAARAKRIQRNADVAARRPVSPIPVIYVTTADWKKVAAAKRKRKSWQRWDLACCLKSNPLAQRPYSVSGSSDHSEGWY
jgi:hypothetical protein